jgi:hypothetical protein
VDLLVKVIKFILFLLLLLLLSPIIVLNYLFVLYTVVSSPPNYEKQGSKGETFYESLEMSIGWITVLYKQFMNKEISNDKIIDSKFGKILTKGIAYTIGLIVFIGPILNMCISGYYMINKDNILQKNIELKQETESLKEDLRAYGKVYNSKNIRFNAYDKVEEIKDFIFEYQVESKKAEDFCIEVMEKNNYKFVNEMHKDKTKTLLFRKNEYIAKIQFLEDKDVEITLKRYDYFRESKWYGFLSPIILVTSPFNPLRRFETFNFSW